MGQKVQLIIKSISNVRWSTNAEADHDPTFGPSAYKSRGRLVSFAKQNGAFPCSLAFPKQYSSLLLLSAKATDVDVHAAE